MDMSYPKQQTRHRLVVQHVPLLPFIARREYQGQGPLGHSQQPYLLLNISQGLQHPPLLCADTSS